jgi:phage shock protein PspC (stress-responsive transcriptional regulator)
MNKTIIININGIVFHIEEDAYEVLKNYMTDVKRHFMNSADSLEITTDIENRIAEMFNELLANEHKQVIIEQDVKSVIEQMGTVEDFEHAEEDSNTSYTHTYQNSDTRRLFRDPDDHLVAGVCAGIANYFDIQAAWIRLAFALTFFFAGSGLILYIILWIVIPKATTRADRMAMKGEKLNLQGFKKNFEEEIGSVRNNFSNFHQEATPFVYKARDFAGDFFHHLGVFFEGAGKILLKLIGVAILIGCLSAMVFFIVAFIALLSVGNFPAFHDLPYNLLKHHHAEYIYVSAFLMAIIPLVSIMLITLRGIFNVGSISRSSGTTALVLWLCAIGVFVYYVIGIAGEFRESADLTKTIDLKSTKDNTYRLTMNHLKYLTAEDSSQLNIKGLSSNVIINNDDDNDFQSFSRRNIRLNIEKSDVDHPILVESFRARGNNFKNAFENAQNIKYIFTQQDSILKFDNYMYGKNDDLWHDEEVDITLKIPMNAKVIVEHDLDRIADISVRDCNFTNKKDGDKLTDAIFTMTDNGLQCKVDTLVTDTIIRKHMPIDSMKIKQK